MSIVTLQKPYTANDAAVYENTTKSFQASVTSREIDESQNRPSQLQDIVSSTIDSHDTELHGVNSAIHSHPETAYEEHFAHDTITSYLRSLDLNVKQHAYGLDTSFEVEIVTGGRLAILCA